MKRIILSSDGTGNRGGAGYDTNVWRLHTAINKRLKAKNTRQLAYYHDGVGTEKLKLWKMLSGATGMGLKRIIIELYVFLANNYEDGDEIYLFGFSRGAFAVRILAGMIAKNGILDKSAYHDRSDDDLYKDAYCLYRQLRYQDKCLKDEWLIEHGNCLTRMIVSVRQYCRLQYSDSKTPQLKQDCPKTLPIRHEKGGKQTLKFIGVWDTVDAYAIPSDWFAEACDVLFNTTFRKHNNSLSSKVKAARHALAIDDERRTFEPVLWKDDHNNLKQVWFPGVHSNVGGGYPKQGIAWESLEWMMLEAAEEGLAFVKSDISQFTENKCIYDKLYDSRSGFGSFYLHKTRDIQKLWDRYVYPKDRERKRSICEGGFGDNSKENQAAKETKLNPKVLTPKPLIHISVFERVASRVEGYAPMNLPDDFDIEASDSVNENHNEVIKKFSKTTIQKLQDSRGNKEYQKSFLHKFHRYDTYLGILCVLTPIITLAVLLLQEWSDWRTLQGVGIMVLSVVLSVVVWFCLHKSKQSERKINSRFWRNLIAGEEWRCVDKLR